MYPVEEDEDRKMMESNTATDAQQDDDDLPHPCDDPALKYVHEGKRYDTPLGGRFEIVAFDPDSRPDVGGLVTIQDCDGNPINSEHEHKKGGMSFEALARHIPKADDRGVYSVEGILAMLSRLEFMEVDPYSYDNLYWSQQDEH
jgi:hypothetical protein